MTNRSVDCNEYHSLGSMVCRPRPAAELMQGLFFQGQAVEGAAVLQMVQPGCARLMLNFLFLSPRSGFIQLLHQKPPDSQTPTQQGGQHQSKHTKPNRQCCEDVLLNNCLVHLH